MQKKPRPKRPSLSVDAFYLKFCLICWKLIIAYTIKKPDHSDQAFRALFYAKKLL
jgi:hypothetical protein